ncbi:MAG TPA: hypothetical protein VGQ08_12825 [Nitrospiraceae bacterium]|jgi:hypothetical protein|nr:hypothetical protein [Nitrospiraceae bacterium]
MQFGYVNLWLWEQFGGWGFAEANPLGVINIRYYEEMARHPLVDNGKAQ